MKIDLNHIYGSETNSKLKVGAISVPAYLVQVDFVVILVCQFETTNLKP